MTAVTFSEKNIKKLKKAYDKALANNKESFEFEGQEVVTSYAKYILMYLDTTIKELNKTSKNDKI